MIARGSFLSLAAVAPLSATDSSNWFLPSAADVRLVVGWFDTRYAVLNDTSTVVEVFLGRRRQLGGPVRVRGAHIPRPPNGVREWTEAAPPSEPIRNPDVQISDVVWPGQPDAVNGWLLAERGGVILALTQPSRAVYLAFFRPERPFLVRYLDGQPDVVALMRNGEAIEVVMPSTPDRVALVQVPMPPLT